MVRLSPRFPILRCPCIFSTRTALASFGRLARGTVAGYPRRAAAIHPFHPPLYASMLQDDDGEPTEFGLVDPKLLYGKEGWCQVRLSQDSRGAGFMEGDRARHAAFLAALLRHENGDVQ